MEEIYFARGLGTVATVMALYFLCYLPIAELGYAPKETYNGHNSVITIRYAASALLWFALLIIVVIPIVFGLLILIGKAVTELAGAVL